MSPVEQPPSRPAAARARRADSAGTLWSPGDPPVGLYVHVPFCRSLCTYCAFAKTEYVSSLAETWLDGLAAEVRHRARTTWEERPETDTVFLGGGTPSALTPAQWARLGEILHAGFSVRPGAEITSEANPESFSPETAAAMAAIGVNRVSLGVQSLDSGELALLGRIHGAAEVGRAVRTARELGLPSINLDLMYALPGQTEERFAASLAGVLDLEPDHLSAYCLGLEPGTPLAGSVGEGTIPLPDDALARACHDRVVEMAANAGLAQYEISNFAREGAASRHNLKYWRREDVIALGPSSHALLAGSRWVNPARIGGWVAAYANGKAPAPRPVPRGEARFEWIFLHLRLTGGFSLEEYRERWGEPLEEEYGPVVNRLTAGGLLRQEEGMLRLTREAQFVSDGVFAEFAPRVG